MPGSYDRTRFKTGTEVPCPVCNKLVYRSGAEIKQGRRYCSKTCELASTKKTRKICPVCNKEFVVYTSIAHRFNVCSRKCRVKDVRYYNCHSCGKTFVDSEKRYDRKFCSELCRRPPLFRPCKNCGKQFRIGPMDLKSMFCSFVCYRRFRGESSLESKIRKALMTLDISFIQEMKLGRYSVDFYLPESNIVLEVDGDYWHRDTKKDSIKDKYLSDHGKTVVRISGSEITSCSNIISLLYSKLSIRYPKYSDNHRAFPRQEQEYLDHWISTVVHQAPRI